MKMTHLGDATKTSSTGTASMPQSLRDKLNGLTINEALAAGHIDDLGNKTGIFAVPHKDENVDRWYAIVQGTAVPMSRRAGDAAFEGKLDDNTIGSMKFQKGISTIEGDGFGKEWFNLGLGGTLNLDMESELAVSLGSVPVDAK